MSLVPESFERIVALGRLVDGDDPRHDALAGIVAAASDLIPGCDSASITLLEGGNACTPVAVDHRADRLDGAQYDEDSGPCLTAGRTGEMVQLVGIAAGPGPYEGFRSAAVAEGIHDSLSVPLPNRRQTAGALNLYSEAAGFDETSRATATLLALQAAVLVDNAELFDRTRTIVAGMNVALQSRDVIGQAKGILMASATLTSDGAFELLRERSQRDNTKLRDVAEMVVLTGTIDY